MIRFRFWVLGYALLAATALPMAAAIPPLLDHAVQKWTAAKADWAFTQRVRSLADDGQVKEERLERYDPSLPDNRRWRLLAFNGKEPTEEQRDRWETRKNRRPRKRANKPPGEYFDFENATVASETAGSVTYDVAIRPEAAVLVQVEKLVIEVTVNKESRAIEHMSATLREPMRVALGLARITDLDLDVRFDPDATPSAASPDPAEATGSAQATVSKLGHRAEYAWSDFQRVTTYASPDAGPRTKATGIAPAREKPDRGRTPPTSRS